MADNGVQIPKEETVPRVPFLVSHDLLWTVPPMTRFPFSAITLQSHSSSQTYSPASHHTLNQLNSSLSVS